MLKPLMRLLGGLLLLAGLILLVHDGHEYFPSGRVAFSTLADLPVAPALIAAGALLILLFRARKRSPVATAPGPQAQPLAPVPVRPAKTQSRDRQFLPAALEVLETPPSPVATAFIWAICIVFAAALTWSYFGWIDIYAVAQGKIQPSGRSKVVQPLEPGKVVAVLVENGSRVNAGDVLLELDPTETTADRDSMARDLASAGAEAARRRAAIAAAQSESLRPGPIDFRIPIDAEIRRREQEVLAADLAQLASTRTSLKAQLAEKLATKERLTTSIAARARLLALGKERVAMRETLEKSGAGSRALTIEALQQYETQVTTDVGEQGQVLEIDAAVRSLERKIEEMVAQFIADQTQKLSEIEHKRDRLLQELVKAESKSEHKRLRSPVAGTVQQLAITTVGQVVGSGQSLMTIVPLDGPIEVEAYLLNKDIGFVEAGQPAVVKVEAFPFTRYGAINGAVAKVSGDAVDQRDAVNLSDPSNSIKQGTAQNQGVQSLVFPATIKLERSTMSVDGKDVSLSPGMAVTVEIKTGQRRIIDYLLSPIREVASRSGHER
jgi:hemolysin D